MYNCLSNAVLQIKKTKTKTNIQTNGVPVIKRVYLDCDQLMDDVAAAIAITHSAINYLKYQINIIFYICSHSYVFMCICMQLCRYARSNNRNNRNYIKCMPSCVNYFQLTKYIGSGIEYTIITLNASLYTQVFIQNNAK